MKYNITESQFKLLTEGELEVYQQLINKLFDRIKKDCSDIEAPAFPNDLDYQSCDEAEVISEMTGVLGNVLDDQLTIACGTGALRLLLLQRPGGKWLNPIEFLNGYDLPIGSQLYSDSN